MDPKREILPLLAKGKISINFDSEFSVGGRILLFYLPCGFWY